MQRIQWLDAGVDERLSSSLQMVVRLHELRRHRNRLGRKVSADSIGVGVGFKDKGIRRNQVRGT